MNVTRNCTSFVYKFSRLSADRVPSFVLALLLFLCLSDRPVRLLVRADLSPEGETEREAANEARGRLMWLNE